MNHEIPSPPGDELPSLLGSNGDSPRFVTVEYAGQKYTILDKDGFPLPLSTETAQEYVDGYRDLGYNAQITKEEVDIE
jgi:hypothetical protein